MSNAFYEPTPVQRHVLGRSEDVNTNLRAIAAGFDKLPSPLEITQGLATYFVATGGPSAYAGTTMGAMTAYTAGYVATVVLPVANTGAATFNVNGLGARAIKRIDGTDPAGGSLPAGRPIQMVYDGAQFVLLGAGYVDLVTALRQATPYDATPGTVLGPGSFGLGGPYATLSDANALAAFPLGTTHWLVSSATVNGPAGVTRGVLTHHKRRDGSDVQEVVTENGTGYAATGSQWRRAATEGVLSPWRSDSLHSEGSNANGSWKRWCDGRQECRSSTITVETTTVTGPFYRSFVIGWTFPIAFDTAQEIWPTNLSQHASCWASAICISGTLGEATLYSTSSQTSRSLRLSARGTW